MRVRDAILATQWAIEEQYLVRLDNCDQEITAAGNTENGASGDYSIENGVATIPVKGVIFQEDTFLAQFICWLFGGTILSGLGAQIQSAKNDPLCTAVMLDVNSPGGEALGIEAAAREIAACAAVKPVTAFVDGMAASAAYWLASAATSIVLSGDSSQVGSIGAVLTVRDSREADKKAGITRHEIVSSQSPLKRVDPATEEGRAHLNGYIDQMAEVFIQNVATNRGTTPDAVKADFGQGAMILGPDAVKRGMADRVQSREGMMNALRLATQFGGSAANSPKEVQAEMPNPTPAAGTETAQIDVAAVRAEAIKAERTRVAAILNHTEATGREALARTLALESDLDAGAAGNILAAAPKTTAAPANPLAAAMAAVANPKVGADAAAATANDEQAEIAAVLAAGGK